MRRLTRSATVKAPSTFALAYMSTYFMDRGAQSGGADLALRFPLPRFPVSGLTIEKRVKVHLKYHGGSGQPLRLAWEPLDSSPVPGFEGTLETAPETETTCRLTIAGTYAPPGGIAGVAFDQLVGVHIAGATIDALLDRFTAAIEAEYSARLVP